MGHLRMFDPRTGATLYDSRHEDLDEKTLDYVSWYDRMLVKLREEVVTLKAEARKLDKRAYGNKGKRAALAWRLAGCRNGMRNLRKIGGVAIKRESELAIHRDLADRGIIPHRDEDLT